MIKWDQSVGTFLSFARQCCDGTEYLCRRAQRKMGSVFDVAAKPTGLIVPWPDGAGEPLYRNLRNHVRVVRP